MEQIVYFSKSSEMQDILLFCDELSNIKNTDKLIIDFSQMGRVDPFALLYTSHIIKRFVKKNPQTTITCRNFHSKNYASFMGFFKSFGLEHGNGIGEAKGSKTYLPITQLTRQKIIDESAIEWEAEQKVIEREAGKLAKILSRQKDEEIEKTLTYSITEIMRNVFEHSESDDFFYCAQFWPRYEKVEVSIVDNGIGLQTSINKNPHISTSNDKEAIQLAMMPGISSTNYEGAIIDTTDPWHNSGFGLYMTSRIARNGGEMAVCSGFHCVYQNENGKTHYPLKHFCRGTAVKLVIKTNLISDLAKMLDGFHSEGLIIAKEYEGIGNIDAPSASKYITSDFSNGKGGGDN